MYISRAYIHIYIIYIYMLYTCVYIWQCPINCLLRVPTEKRFQGRGLLDHHLAKLANLAFWASCL